MSETIDDTLIKAEAPPVFKFRGVIIWGLFILLGIFFRVMRWPGGLFFIVVASGGLSAYCLNSYLYLKGKEPVSNFLTWLCFIWTMYLIAGVFFIDYSLVNYKGLGVYILVFAIYFCIYFGIIHYRNNWENKYRKVK